MTPPPSRPPHAAARVEDVWRTLVSTIQRIAGWTPRVEPFPSYGSTTWVRVLGRVSLGRPGTSRRTRPQNPRGWRYFITAPAPGEPVWITIAGHTVTTVTDRSGYIDTVIPVCLSPGWHSLTVRTRRGHSTTGEVLIIPPGRRLGVISDIDDTVMVTSVPRALLALWNTLVRHSSTRMPVPHMAELYQTLAAAPRDTPFIYLSTGAWNVCALLQRFLRRHHYPRGPLLLTDWGPTPTGWFRSGPEHKYTSLERLMREFPDIHWLLIGDDGQHDPEIYQTVAHRYPNRVAAIAIRQLTPTQQVLSHGLPIALPYRTRSEVPFACGADGYSLGLALRHALRGPGPVHPK